jgi:outer membrane murein-binding lipoprotein Lpp
MIAILTPGGEMLKKSVIWAVMALLPACGWAGYYQYRDASGVVHFTDAIEAVPENQRGVLQVHRDLGDTAPGLKVAATVPAVGQPQGNPAGHPEDPDVLESRLKTLKSELDAAYRDITEAKERLPEDPPASDDPASIDYARQVRDLNARIAAYEKTRLAYETGVNAFNQQIQATADGPAASETP